VARKGIDETRGHAVRGFATINPNYLDILASTTAA
jgi:hypothetical protein